MLYIVNKVKEEGEETDWKRKANTHSHGEENSTQLSERCSH